MKVLSLVALASVLAACTPAPSRPHFSKKEGIDPEGPSEGPVIGQRPNPPPLPLPPVEPLPGPAPIAGPMETPTPQPPVTQMPPTPQPPITQMPPVTPQPPVTQMPPVTPLPPVRPEVVPHELSADATRLVAILKKTQERKFTLLGMHQPDVNDYFAWQRYFRFMTGSMSVIWSASIDGATNTEPLIKELKDQAKKGVMVSLTWTPNIGKDAKAQLTAAEWDDLLKDGGSLNKRLLDSLQKLQVILKNLEQEKITVLLRPLPQLDNAGNWWGGKTGANGSAQLFESVRSQLAKDLKNIIYIWDVADVKDATEGLRPPAYDIASLSISGNNMALRAKYEALKKLAPEKIIASAMTDAFPTDMNAAGDWAFMVGSGPQISRFHGRKALNGIVGKPTVLTLKKFQTSEVSKP